MPTLIVHHLQVSQSERIPWLCEELNIEYQLKTYKRAPLLAPPEYKALHPQGSAPVIQYGDLTLAESAACVEYICHKLADGKLFIKPSAPNYADFLYWFHFSNGTLQAGMSLANMVRRAGFDKSNQVVTFSMKRNASSLGSVEARLKHNDYLSGHEFTAADIMSFWCFTNMRYWYPYSLKDYPNIQQYIKRISSRDAYQKAMKESDPGLELALAIEPPKPFASVP